MPQIYRVVLVGAGHTPDVRRLMCGPAFCSIISGTSCTPRRSNLRGTDAEPTSPPRLGCGRSRGAHAALGLLYPEAAPHPCRRGRARCALGATLRAGHLPPAHSPPRYPAMAVRPRPAVRIGGATAAQSGTSASPRARHRRERQRPADAFPGPCSPKVHFQLLGPIEAGRGRAG